MVGICRGEDGNGLNNKFGLGEHINSREKGLTAMDGLLAKVARGRLRCGVSVNLTSSSLLKSSLLGDLSGNGKRAEWG
jgi:hypothetical protein